MFRKILKKVVGKDQPQQTDDFIKRIRSLVIGEGMLDDGNIKMMDFAIENMPNHGSVIEIGSYGGLSTNLLIYLMKKHKKNNSFFNSDAWIYEGYHDGIEKAGSNIDGREDILRSAYSVYMKNAFMNSTKFLSSHNLPHSFHLFSDSFFEKWDAHKNEVDLFGNEVQLGGAISFAYIDGGHSFETAWKDFTNVNKNLLKNGYLLLDDSADHLNFGSAKMMATIKKDKQFKVIAQNPNYLLQKK